MVYEPYGRSRFGREIENKVADFLSSRGWKIGISFGSRGPADIIAIKNGRKWCIQVKASEVAIPNFTIKRAIHRNISPTSVNLMFKTASTFVGIDAVRIWFHCCKKAFKKVLVQANIDPEIRVALEAHKVGKSEHNYFDYHDVEFVRKEYKKADWSREGAHKVDQLEKTVTDLLERNKEQEEKIKELSEHKVRDTNKDRRIEERLNAIEYGMYLQEAYRKSYRKNRRSLTQ